MKLSALRKFLLWIIKRSDIKITTVHIEYYKTNEADPIVFKFGHESRLK